MVQDGLQFEHWLSRSLIWTAGANREARNNLSATARLRREWMRERDNSRIVGTSGVNFPGSLKSECSDQHATSWLSCFGFNNQHTWFWHVTCLMYSFFWVGNLIFKVKHGIWLLWPACYQLARPFWGQHVWLWHVTCLMYGYLGRKFHF